MHGAGADTGRPASFSRPPATDGSEEAALVDTLCTPGGLRAAPEREDLRLFVESIAAVNGTTIAELLREKMVRSSCFVPPVSACGYACAQDPLPLV